MKTSFVEANEGRKEDYSQVLQGERARLGKGPVCQKKTRALRLGEERRAGIVNVAILAHFEPIFHFL